MTRWFRFYSEAMRNPKVARLTDKEFRLWVELLAVAAEHDGVIPAMDDLKYLLKRRLDHLSTGVQRLISLGLIDLLGEGYEPHNWSKFQYKSDVSTDRVRKHRGKGNVSETPPEAETEAETDSEASASGADAPGLSAADMTKAVWDNGKMILKAAGHDDRQAGSIIGRFRKSFTDSQVLVALSRCQIEQPSEPVEWLTKTLQAEAGLSNGKRSFDQRETTRQTGERVAARYAAAGGGTAQLLPGPGSPGWDARERG